MMYDYEMAMVIPNQGYHLEADVGYYVSGRLMTPAEREEEYRAQMIDAIVAERQKKERRNFKGYE